MLVNLKHKDSGMIKPVKLGFSWTVFFFGFFPPIFRGDAKWFIIILLASALTFGVAGIIFSFLYNKIYIKELLEKGYLPADESSKNTLVYNSIIAK